MLALRRMTHFRGSTSYADAHGTHVADRESERVYKKQLDNRLRRSVELCVVLFLMPISPCVSCRLGHSKQHPDLTPLASLSQTGDLGMSGTLGSLGASQAI